MREADFGNLSQARRQIEEAIAERPDATSRALSGLVLARAGAPEKAIAIAHGLHRQFPSDSLINGYWVPTILAATQLQANPTKAVEILDAAIPYELGLPQTPTNAVPYPIYVRGLALLAAGEGGKAAKEFQKILDHPGIVGNYPLGALAHLGVARAYAAEGGIPTESKGSVPPSRRGAVRSQKSADMLASADKAYQEFLVLWRDADLDIPILKQARRESAAIASSEARLYSVEIPM